MKTKTAFLYIRVSTDEQADKGYSLRSQEENLRRWCTLNDVEIKGVYIEDHSAKTFDRPEFQKMLVTIKKHRGFVNHVLFVKWDRFSRNTSDAYKMIGMLNKAGVDPQAIEQPLDMNVPENKIMLAFYLAAPEVENDRRALNTYAGMRRASKEGRWMGPAPVGYLNKVSENGKKHIAPGPMAPVMKWFFEQVAEGKYTVESLVREARAKGLTQGRMALWAALRNPVYCGKVRVPAWKSEPEDIVPGQHEAIISEAVFLQVQEVLSGKKKIRRVNVEVDERFPLRGLLICHSCGRILTASASKGQYRYYSYYHCTGGCKVRFSADQVNGGFQEELRRLRPRPVVLELFRKVLELELHKSEGTRRDELSIIRDEIALLNDRRARALKRLEADEMDPDDYRQIKKECESGVIALEEKLSGLVTLTADMAPAVEAALTALGRLDKLYEDASAENKRNIVSSIFPGKLEYSGEHFRTFQMNEVFSLICTLGAAFSGQKKEKSGEKTELSCMVAHTIHFSNFFLSDLQKLAQLHSTLKAS